MRGRWRRHERHGLLVVAERGRESIGTVVVVGHAIDPGRLETSVAQLPQSGPHGEEMRVRICGPYPILLHGERSDHTPVDEQANRSRTAEETPVDGQIRRTVSRFGECREIGRRLLRCGELRTEPQVRIRLEIDDGVEAQALRAVRKFLRKLIDRKTLRITGQTFRIFFAAVAARIVPFRESRRSLVLLLAALYAGAAQQKGYQQHITEIFHVHHTNVYSFHGSKDN